MPDDLTNILASDAFLTCIFLAVLSMFGLRLFPFGLSDLKGVSRRDLWKLLTQAPSSQSQLERAISAFYHYEALSLLEVRQMHKSYAKIGRAHKCLGYELGYPTKLERLTSVTKINGRVTTAVAELALEDIELEPSELGS